MIPARWKTVAPSAPAQQPAHGRGVADVALHELDVRDSASGSASASVPGSTRQRTRSKRGWAEPVGVVGVRLVQEVHEPVAEPAGKAGDEGEFAVGGGVHGFGRGGTERSPAS